MVLSLLPVQCRIHCSNICGYIPHPKIQTKSFLCRTRLDLTTMQQSLREDLLNIHFSMCKWSRRRMRHFIFGFIFIAVTIAFQPPHLFLPHLHFHSNYQLKVSSAIISRRDQIRHLSSTPSIFVFLYSAERSYAEKRFIVWNEDKNQLKDETLIS